MIKEKLNCFIINFKNDYLKKQKIIIYTKIIKYILFLKFNHETYMLFFFPSLHEDFRYPIALKHLFEISTGLLDNGTEYFFINELGESKPIRMLRMGMFNPITREMQGEEELNQNDHKINKIRSGDEEKKMSKSEKKEKEISRDKILTANDYLICTRVNKNGGISSYSLINSPIDLTPDEIGPCIISHHFIYLRPRTDIGHLFVPYLHLLLDAIIKLELTERNKDSKKNILSIKALENLVVNYPVNPQKQEQIYKDYQLHKANRIIADREMAIIEGQIVEDFESLNKIKND